MEIGIIGFGSFGRLIAKHLKTRAKIYVSDIINKEKEAKEIGVSFVSVKQAASKEIVILSMPMENLQEILISIKEILQKNALVLDVCSLKVFSCELMKKILPKDVEIIGTHPLFGPQSAPNSIEGSKIAIIPIRTSRLDEVKSFCESLGLKVFITTSKEHDKQMASSQALVHFIGQAMENCGIKRTDLSTRTFDKLMDIAEIIRNDTPALFNNMQTMNPFAKEVREKFLDELNKINGLLV
ncbi:MAG: prephenate dehydrogenase/arogenate dehydrogenase family protein [Candidatus Nanoarchaeia archaeon]|nr:prephenate dehydrogenase/arogenate dehydrogenase family protein [Candidatus Nanoarchaeia archaeon]MDD5740619.1 prephenate dehydrogenase/arogenate dehydrogenase family protein [Candidatus Nanoarchaeia archaeon]